jgi:hypothetical protein
MVARAFVVNIAENAFDRIGPWAIARQPNQFEMGMLFQPTVNCLRFMKLVIVEDYINLAIAFLEGLLKMIQQFAEEDIVFLRSQDVIGLPGRRFERCSQIMFLVFAWGVDLKLRSFEHSLVAVLGE